MEPEEWVDDAAPVAAAAAVQPKPSPAPAAAVAAAAAPAAPAQQVRRPEKNEQKKIIFDWAHLLPPRAFATPNEPSSLVFSPLFLNFSSHKTTSEATMTTSSSRRRWLKGHKACSGAVLSADSIGSFFLSLALLSADRRSSNLALSDLFLSFQSLRLSPTSCPSRRRWEEEEQQLGRPVLLPTEGRTRRRRHSSIRRRRRSRSKRLLLLRRRRQSPPSPLPLLLPRQRPPRARRRPRGPASSTRTMTTTTSLWRRGLRQRRRRNPPPSPLRPLRLLRSLPPRLLRRSRFQARKFTCGDGGIGRRTSLRC